MNKELSGEELYHLATGFKESGDYDNYFMYLVMSANKDYESAKKDFEIEYIEDNFDKQDYEKTKSFYEETKEFSYSLAMIGYTYLSDTRGFPHNYNFAKACFEKASETNCFATYYLATMYAEKYFSSYADHVHAFPLYKKAFEQGSIVATNLVGLAYYHGHGVNKDYKLSKEAYELGLQKYPDYASVLNNIGVLYKVGFNDRPKSIEFYQKSAERYSVTACGNLGCLYKTSKEYNLAIPYLQKGVELKSTKCARHLAEIYEKGLSVPVDFEKARDLLEKGVEYSNKEELSENINSLYKLYNNKDCTLKNDVDYVIKYLTKINRFVDLQKIYGYTFDSFIIGKIKENDELQKKIDKLKEQIVSL